MHRPAPGRAGHRTARSRPRCRPSRSRAPGPGRPRSGRRAETPGKLRLRLPGSRRSGSPLSRTSGSRASDAGEEAPPQPQQPLRLLGHFGLGERRRRAQPDAERRRQRAGAHAPLLAAAIDQRRDAAPAAGAAHRARRCPWVRRSCGRRSTADRSSSPRHRAGSCRPPGPRRCGTARRVARHSAPISASGWITPISLWAAMTETSAVRSSSAAAERDRDRRARCRRPAGWSRGSLRAPAPWRSRARIYARSPR